MDNKQNEFNSNVELKKKKKKKKKYYYMFNQKNNKNILEQKNDINNSLNSSIQSVSSIDNNLENNVEIQNSIFDNNVVSDVSFNDNIQEQSPVISNEFLDDNVIINNDEKDDYHTNNLIDNNKVIESEVYRVDNSNEKNKNLKKYFGFNQRIILNSILLFLSLCLLLYFIFSSFSIKKNQTVGYSEIGDIDYHVFLNKNEFYEDEYLPEDMLYISNLINKINVNFNYDFQIEEEINAEFEYKIVGLLSIMDNTAKNSFYQKEFTLLDKQVVKMNNDVSKKITENIAIDYMYYNNIANDFKKKFGVTTSSNFIVKIIIKPKSLDEKIVFNDEKILSISMPLSQREIRITTNSINEKNSLVKNTYVEMTNYLNLMISCVFVIITIFLTISLIKKVKLILPRKSVYDKFVSEILNEYDRYIINTNVKPNIRENVNIVKLDDFQELLDVRYNTKMPIKFYNITDHQKCMFYIVTNNEIYEYIIKAVDLDIKNDR